VFEARVAYVGHIYMWGIYICGAYAEVPQAKGRVDGEHLVKS
jgi:hypothetical protein